MRLTSQINNKMKKTISKLSVAVGLAMLPMVTYALSFSSGSGTKKDLKYIISLITDYLKIGLALIMSLAVIFFVWNVFRYFFRPEQDRKEAATYVMYALIGFFVMLSI